MVREFTHAKNICAKPQAETAHPELPEHQAFKSNLATHVNIPRYHARRQCRWHLGSATQGYLRRQSMWRVVIWSLIWQTCSVLDVFITFWVRSVRYGKVWWFDRNMRGCIITFCITSILGPVYLTPQIARELV